MLQNVIRGHSIAAFLTELFGFILGPWVSGSWSPKHCWVSVPDCGVGLKSNHFLVDHFYKLCATMAVAYLASRSP